MRYIRTKVELEEVEDKFLKNDENLNDISIVKITLVKDVHYDAFDLIVEFFGKGKPDVENQICEFYIELKTLSPEELSTQGFDRQKLHLLFEAHLFNELKKNNVNIVWNEGDQTETIINLSFPGTGYLVAMER